MQSVNNLDITPYVRKLIVLTYRTTSHFPPSELYGLTSQMRRSAVGIGSCIAEGCGQSTDPAFRKSLDDAMGEASELEFQCWVAADLGFGRRDDLRTLARAVEQVKKMLARLIVAIRRRGAGRA